MLSDGKSVSLVLTPGPSKLPQNHSSSSFSIRYLPSTPIGSAT